MGNCGHDYKDFDNLSKRGQNWVRFSFEVLRHIEEYTVPQYGDAPNDQVEGWTPEQCMDSIKRYTNRFGKNARGKDETFRDLKKIAHYAGLIYEKLEGK